MKVSYNWLNTKYFDGQLPTPPVVAEKLTFHAWEIEDIEQLDQDTVFDVKVLPDKAMWALSHRGIAKDLSVILALPLQNDPLASKPVLEPRSDEVRIEIESDNCRRFAAALIRGVRVGPSPDWLKSALASIGQRSINNIVDASNYVMFDLGQPSHAFDATKISGGILVRQAKDGERLSALDENEYMFTTNDTLISSLEGAPLSIAGIKGGRDSGISDLTSDIIVEVANWDPITTRKTASRLKLRSDASSRYENGIVPEMVPYGLQAVIKLILEVAGGQLIGYNEVIKSQSETVSPKVSLHQINSVLGVNMSETELISIVDRFGWEHSFEDGVLTVTSPFERTDLQIAEDIIEEIGRIYGYDQVTAVTPLPIPVAEINKRFYYSEKIRTALTNIGFSEIFTSSFRSEDEVRLANAFAADKGYLRSSLTTNMKEALAKNLPHADLLGLKQLKLFEIGTAFSQESEKFLLTVGVASPSGFKAKTDDPALLAALDAISGTLAIDIEGEGKDGVIEIDFGDLLNKLPEPSSYETVPTPIEVTYKPFSVYPAMARDIAMWVDRDLSEDEIEKLLMSKAGELCVRITLFDRFEKEGRVSYAFRLVFQSKEKTLESSEVDAIMNGVYQAARERGFEVR